MSENSDDLEALRENVRAFEEIVLFQTMALGLTLRGHAEKLAVLIDERLTEVSPQQRVSPYGRTLIRVSQYCRELERGWAMPD